MVNIPADEKSITVNIEDLFEEITSIKACNEEMKECIKRQDDEINKLKEKQKIYDRIIPVLITENRMLKQVIRNEAHINTELKIQTKDECMGFALNEICTMEKISEELQAINLRLEKNEKTLQKLQEQQDRRIHGLDHEVRSALKNGNWKYLQILKALKNRNWKECVKIIRENKPEHDKVYKQLQNVKLQQCLPLVAAEKSYVELIQVLLYNGLNVNEKVGNNGKSMLHRAAECGNNDVMELLLSKGADINLNDNKGSTALHDAAWNGHVSTVKMLIEKGAYINLRDRKDWTPLHYAAYKGHVNIVQLLIEKGANINIRENDGSTPLHIAAYKGHVSTVKLLIEKGADINTRNSNGYTPLHRAVLYCRISVVKCLLDNNCNRQIKNEDGKTALDKAREKGYSDIVRLLLDK